MLIWQSEAGKTALSVISAASRPLAEASIPLPERGTLRNDLRPGVRTIRFEQRVTIAFQVEANRVTILRVLYGGRDVSKAFQSRRS